MAALQGKGLCLGLKPEQLSCSNNKVPVHCLIDGIREFTKVPEQHLLNWINLQVQPDHVVTDLFKDLQDGRVLAQILHHLDPEQFGLNMLNVPSKSERILRVCSDLSDLGLGQLADPQQILSGNPNHLQLLCEQLYRKSAIPDDVLVDFEQF